MGNYTHGSEDSGGYSYSYGEPQYSYDYAHGREFAQSYRAAPSYGGRAGRYNDRGGGLDTSGRIAGEGGGGNGISAMLTPAKRLEGEGANSACFGLIEEILEAARPARLLLGFGYFPNDGATADFVVEMMNRFGDKVPLNVGFAEPLFTNETRNLPGIKRPDQIWFPKYGIVTYQDRKALEHLALLKVAAKRVGATVHDQEIQVHSKKEDVARHISGMGLLPQDVVAVLLYHLAKSGRNVPEALIAQAKALGAVAVNVEHAGSMIIPTEKFIIRVDAKIPLSGQQAVFLNSVLSNIINESEVFASPRGMRRISRKKHPRAVDLQLRIGSNNALLLNYQGEEFAVIDGKNGGYSLERS